MITKFLLLLSFFVIAASFISANEEGIFVNGPGWAFDNQANRGGDFTFEIGSPYSGSVGTLGYVIGGSYDLNTGNTTLCVFDAMTNGTCVETIMVLSGSWKVDNILNANRVSGYIFDARNTENGQTATFRWNTLVGMEWWLPRGKIQKRNTLIVDNYYNTFISSSATETGATELVIAAATIDHKYAQFWAKEVPVPAANQTAWTSYARDFTWMHNYGKIPVLGFISVGRVFAMSTDNGTILTQVDSPCGYTSADFRMRDVTIRYNNVQLLVYGNVPNVGFVVCALAFNETLTELWSAKSDEPFYPANGDESVTVIRTAHSDGGFIPVATDHVFVSGTKFNDTQHSYLWAFNVQAETFVWEIVREYADRYNMPVFFNGPSHEHVAVTINGTMAGLDPVNQNQMWKCNWGCQGTPANYRYASGEIGRMMCVSHTHASRIIALSVNPTYNCSLTWQETLPDDVDVGQQNTPDLVTTGWTPLEPFITVLLPSGTVWTMSVRSSAQPAPTPRPTPPPTPPPTLPPTNAPGPLKKYAFQAPYEFGDLNLRGGGLTAAFSEDGPVVAAVGECDVFLSEEEKKEGKKNGESVGIGSASTVLYYQSIPLSQSSAVMDYSFVALPMNYYVAKPISVFSGNGQFVTVSYEENGDKDIVLLYTYPANNNPNNNDVPGRYQVIGRFGGYSQPATDGTGLFFFSTGVMLDAYEYIVGYKQLGDGTATGIAWTKILGNATEHKFINMTSHTSDLIFAYSGSNGYVVYSYLNQLRVQNALTGVDARAPITNPCGYQPSANSWELYYPMELYWIHSAHENIGLAIIDTWDQYGTGTYGLCGVNLSSSNANLDTTQGILLRNMSYIQKIQPIGNTNLFAVDGQDMDWHGVMVVFDATSGQQLYTHYRYFSYGDLISPVPGTDLIVTNLDVAGNAEMGLAILDARTGKALGVCDVGCVVFTLALDSNGNYNAICSVYDYGWIVRSLQFNKTIYDCSVIWETNVGHNVVSMNNDDAQITVDQQRYVILTLEEGTVVAVSPEAGAPPTPVPPIPTGTAHPASATVTSISPRWVSPKTIVPTITDVSSISTSYGPVSFAAVDAGIMYDSPNSLEADPTSTTGAPAPRHTIILAYQSLVPAGTKVLDGIHYILAPTTLTWDPVWLGRTDTRNAAAWATRTGDGLAVVISFPTNTFAVSRYGAFSLIATDGNGTAFFSIGSDGEKEQFVAYQLSADGSAFTKLWGVDLYPRADSGFKLPNKTSHTGNPTYTVDHNGNGVVTFSFLNNTHSLNAKTGAKLGEMNSPCGFTPPLDPFNNFAPFPMFVNSVSLANSSTVLATVIPISDNFDNGFFGICTTDSDGKFQLWSQRLQQIGIVVETITSTTDLVGSDYFVIDATTQPLGNGYMIGFDATSGKNWTQPRGSAAGSKPAVQIYAGQYMVINWPDPSQTDKFLSLVDATSGQANVQCSWSCRDQPGAATVTIDGATQTIYVCALSEHPEVIRAVYFKQVSGQTSYTCETYWEYTLDTATNIVSPAGANSIAVGLDTGATATFEVASSVTPITPVPQETTPVPAAHTTPAPTPVPVTPVPPGHTTPAPTPVPPGQTTPAPTPSPHGNNSEPSTGLSGGVVAAIVILVLLAVAIAVGGIYLIRRRNVRRSAMSEASAGMEYGSSANPETEGGYGAIA